MKHLVGARPSLGHGPNSGTCLDALGGLESGYVKVAVASDGSQVSPHFGRCERYVLADVDNGEVTALTVLENPGHEPGVLPALLHSKGVDVVIAGGMGPRAVGLFHDHGIEPVVGVSGPVDEVLARFVAGQLETGPSMCDH